MLMALKAHTSGLVAAFGLPIRHRDVIYNVVAVVANRTLVGMVPKENLATGDVQYENRWYSGWPRTRVEAYIDEDGQETPIGGLVFQAKGLGRFAFEICEDGWKGIRPGLLIRLGTSLPIHLHPGLSLSTALVPWSSRPPVRTIVRVYTSLSAATPPVHFDALCSLPMMDESFKKAALFKEDLRWLTRSSTLGRLNGLELGGVMASAI